MNNNEFDLILDKDETIIKTLKPNKKRFLVINVIICAIFFVLLGLGFLIGGILCSVLEPLTEENPYIIFLIIGIACILIFGMNIVYSFVTYKKTVYAITNKRVIIKSGFIGNDFKSLDLNTIGAVSVRVDLLDKFISPTNTGSIDFGSMSMPMKGASGEAGNPSFSFRHIDNPYEIYKEVKEYINASKDESKSC